MPLRPALPLLLVLAVAACTAPAEDPSFDLLTRTGSYERRDQALASAEHRLIARCMAERGFPLRAEAERRPEEQFTPEYRRTRGYGLYAQYAAQPGDVPAGDAYVRGLDEAGRTAYDRALLGEERERRAIRVGDADSVVSFPGGGCTAAAQQALYGDVVRWAEITYLPPVLHREVAEQVGEDPRYRESVGPWAACMADRGFPVDSSEDAQDELRQLYAARGATEELRAREIATAVADGDCADLLGVPELVLRIKRELVGRMPEGEREDLRRVAGEWSAAAARAEEG
ncbi:hypothetical protein [Saccharothrix syringae]|uniref:Lipoprotein n=1 Tax=Saccharothrix syringae TaxID=103733 RepID=A0A5Q0H1J3_SACSY|nr:hypothetical protein [Saccharothrix syringae]QFZ20126.1 hypothetical protein EKG83_24325 [Saccharothrix syringae]